MNETITSTRRLTPKERQVFNRVTSEFVHLQASDAEQITQYAEAVIRYQTALKETKTTPTVTAPVVNRRSGNVVGQKVVRNPAFVTLKESQTQLNALARRLMIDASSAEKRQRLLTKRAQTLAAIESRHSTDTALLNGITPEQIEEQIEIAAQKYPLATHDVLMQEALWMLTVCLPLLAIDPCSDPDLAYMYDCPQG